MRWHETKDALACAAQCMHEAQEGIWAQELHLTQCGRSTCHTSSMHSSIPC